MMPAGFAFTDPLAILVAVIAAAVIGVSKGGLAGVAMLAVPLMSLVISPVQAAGITLPILIASDFMSLWTWWKTWDWRTFRLIMPGAVAGIGLGWATAQYVPEDAVRLIVGVIAIGFFLNWLTQGKEVKPRPHNRAKAGFWGLVTGYTSFVSHTGGPPYQVYAMPLGMDRRTYTGTNVLIFTTINLIKALPYFLLGQFAVPNLVTSAVLMPIALVFTLIGAWIIRRMRPEVFYPVLYILVALVGVKLTWDGITGLWG